MNRIVLIGNGFDLAHGLNTKYEDSDVQKVSIPNMKIQMCRILAETSLI